jgi:hypothetical protein
MKAGRTWIITVSGGVQIYPWRVADKTEVASQLATARADQPTGDGIWYWQR